MRSIDRRNAERRSTLRGYGPERRRDDAAAFVGRERRREQRRMRDRRAGDRRVNADV